MDVFILTKTMDVYLMNLTTIYIASRTNSLPVTPNKIVLRNQNIQTFRVRCFGNGHLKFKNSIKSLVEK